MKRVAIALSAVLAVSGAAVAAHAALAGEGFEAQEHQEGAEAQENEAVEASSVRVSAAQAEAIALKARPGKVVDKELEKEAGGSGLRWSFDIKGAADGKAYEVGVDAMTGKVLENQLESAHPD